MPGRTTGVKALGGLQPPGLKLVRLGVGGLATGMGVLGRLGTGCSTGMGVDALSGLKMWV